MRGVILVVLLFLVLALSACGGSTASDARAVETQVAARIFATQTANVPTPTDTPQPTATPEATATPEPTLTPRPTTTPEADTSIPPRGTYKHGYEITEKFDKFNSETGVGLVPIPKNVWVNSNNVLVFYTYPGTTPAKPSTVMLDLESGAGSWQYLDCHVMTWLLDNTVHLQIQTNHKGTVVDGGVIENVFSFVPTETFLQIVNANQVEVKLCNAEFALSDEQMEALRDVASRMQP